MCEKNKSGRNWPLFRVSRYIAKNKKIPISRYLYGAHERTWTFTHKELDPKSSASASSATCATR